MPNWCENDLTIYGEQDELQRLKDFVKSEDSVFDFDKIVPMPEDLKGINSGFTYIDGVEYKLWRTVDGKSVGVTDEEIAELTAKHGTASWYDWCCSEWGTKWDANDTELVTDDEYQLKYCFNTAWSPPEPVIRALIAQFPKLTIVLEYYECGCAFQGGIRHNEDDPPDVIHEWSGDYYGSRGG